MAVNEELTMTQDPNAKARDTVAAVVGCTPKVASMIHGDAVALVSAALTEARAEALDDAAKVAKEMEQGVMHSPEQGWESEWSVIYSGHVWEAILALAPEREGK